MGRPLGIISYGTAEDRLRLKRVAEAENRSGSDWIIQVIRQRYKELFGEL